MSPLGGMNSLLSQVYPESSPNDSMSSNGGGSDFSESERNNMILWYDKVVIGVAYSWNMFEWDSVSN